MNYPLFTRLSPLSRAYLQDWLFTYALTHPEELTALSAWLLDKYGFRNFS